MDILVIHSLYIPYIFPRYVPCIFPCVFLNLWSQEEISPYHKKTNGNIFIRDFTPFIFLLATLLLALRFSKTISTDTS